MKKVSVVVGFKNGSDDMELLCGGENQAECEAVFNKFRSDPAYEFVGFLRRPAWYKRSKPLEASIRVKRNDERKVKVLEALAATARQRAVEAEMDKKAAERIVEAREKEAQDAAAKLAPQPESKPQSKKKAAKK